MLDQSKIIIEQHVKTHTERSAEDNAAISTLEYFFRSHGKINTAFAKNDKWPNIDGTFEFVANPDISRRPTKNFLVQVKGTHDYKETDGIIKYSLKSLAFPAFIALDVTLDPGILFVVLNPDCRGSERVFWKYISVKLINSIDFNNSSTTINFSDKDEILNTDDSINAFCKKLESIVAHHSFVNRLSSTELIRSDIDKIINVCNKQITESIDTMEIFDLSRDDVSQRILPRLYDLCTATLLLNSLEIETQRTNLRLAWEQASLNIDTKYLATFLKGLKYIDNRIPDDGQSERLLLKYYNFMWQIRKYLQDNYHISILQNLEKFPLNTDEIDTEYYNLVAKAFHSVELKNRDLRNSRFYIQKKTPFFVGSERFYEITLQLAGVYASKYNRITIYTKHNISTNYSIQIGYADATIDLWGIVSKIKIVTNWRVSIDPSCLNKLGKILNCPLKISSNYGEYNKLMDFLTLTGINFIDLIDLKELDFMSLVDSVYSDSKTFYFKNILIKLRTDFLKDSEMFGRNVIRYILLHLKEETLDSIMPNQYQKAMPRTELFITKKCFPFEMNPFISNLTGSKSSESNLIKIADATGTDKLESVRPYLILKNAIKKTGEIYFDINDIVKEKDIVNYNRELDAWERSQGFNINISDNFAYIESFETTTLYILRKLIELSNYGNKGQKALNQKFLRDSGIVFTDELKELAIKNLFVDSHVLLIYGAAGTGKTTLINYISNLMISAKKLFLSKTHTANQNLQRRIENPGVDSDFISFDSFTKKVSLTDYDIIFVDECSTIDNRAMKAFFEKVNPNTLLVLAGDIHQIESIDFGNWFYYAKEIINTPGSNVELLNTWRTDDTNLLNLWDEVRNKGELITEMLVIDGPVSEDIGKNIFKTDNTDEVVLCLNYDGKFGLNNINSYFQEANNASEAVSWQEWVFKEGDHILFNDTSRFPILHNNLKGIIVRIEKQADRISFTIDVSTILTEINCKRYEIEFIDIIDDATRIRLTVYAYDEHHESDEQIRMKSVIPFQLAYAVSIHKAQGLEYDSVKVVIPSNNSEKITHGIFYTAITRAKKKLKIYWSSETMQEIVGSFSTEHSGQKSLDIIKSKLDDSE